MKRSVIRNVWFIFISCLFTLQCVIYINSSGDQTWFAHVAKEINFDYLGFALDRYTNWSSRLLIESLTMFFSVHYKIFYITIFTLTLLLFNSIESLLNRYLPENALHTIFPVIFLWSFDPKLFLGAGIIATMTNYYIPMVLLVIVLLLLQKNKSLYNFIGIILSLLVVMQEQFAIYLFLIISFKIAYYYLTNNLDFMRNSWADCIVLFLSLLGIFSAKIAPGNEVRLVEEINKWYPEFVNLSTYDKIERGFLETNRILFISNELNVFRILYLSLFILSFMKRKFVSLLMSSMFLLSLIGESIGVSNFLSTITFVQQNESTLPEVVILFPIVVYISLITSLAYIFSELFGFFSNKFNICFVLIGVGYICRMVVSFSPTIYVSGVRTFIPLIFSVFISILIIWSDIFEESIKREILL